VVTAAHIKVNKENVGVEFARRFNRLRVVRRFSDDPDTRVQLKHRSEASSQAIMVSCDQDAYHAGRCLGGKVRLGKSASQTVASRIVHRGHQGLR